MRGCKSFFGDLVDGMRGLYGSGLACSCDTVLVLLCVLLVSGSFVGGDAPRAIRGALHAASCRSRTAFVNDVEGGELAGVMLIEPGADKVEEPEAGAS